MLNLLQKDSKKSSKIEVREESDSDPKHLLCPKTYFWDCFFYSASRDSAMRRSNV